MPLIFIVDDEYDTLFAMEYWLKRKGFVVKSFMNTVQMLQNIKETIPDIVLLDIHLNGEDGRETCRYLKIIEKLKKPVFLISTYTDCSYDFKDYQADGFIQKPYNMKEFPAMIERKMVV
jgi:DNA-binding response OmpR family regulator